MIFNAKNLNQTFQYNHFKTETVQSVAHLIQHNYYKLKIDLKYAHYIVKISENHTKSIMFLAESNLLKYFVSTNELSSGPRKFTKLTKPSLAVLRLKRIIIAIYIDQLILLGETHEECLTGSIKTMKMFLYLGLLMHPEKSTFLPTLMSVTDDKKDKIQKSCNSYL